jgi:Holliday junction resolvase
MKKRGYDAERELVEMMRNSGFDAIRVPVSAPSKEALPDVFAVKGSSIIAFEVKSQLRYAYYKRIQVSKLQQFLEIHKIYPRKFAVLAAKFKYHGWCFGIAERLDDYTLKIGEGLSFRELLNKVT